MALWPNHYWMLMLGDQVLAETGGPTVIPGTRWSHMAVSGDLNDPESAVSKARATGRHYLVLGELNTKPSVGYLRLVRNRDV